MDSTSISICIFSFIIVSVFSAALDDPKLYPWPNKFWDSHTTNKTRLSDMKPLGFGSATLRWYDWETFSMKSVNAYPDGVANTTIFIGKKAWIFNDFIKVCIPFTLQVTVVKPDWMIGGTYVGRQVVDGVETDVWEKQDHYYHQSIAGIPQPKLVDAPLDQLGNAIMDHYAAFEARESFPSDTFKIPDYCQFAEERNETELTGVTLTPFGYL